MFALLIGILPSQMYAYQTDYNPPTTQDQEVVDYFTAHNITLYSETWSFNISAPDMEALEDTPVADHQIEFHFYTSNEGDNFIQMRHASPSFFFGLWLDWHYIEPIEPYATQMGYSSTSSRKVGFPVVQYSPVITRANVLALASGNSSVFEVACEHVTMSMALLNQNYTYASLEDSFDGGDLTVLASYEIDFDAMKPSAFTLITQLITFQNPDLGIENDFGDIIEYLMAIGFWIVIAIIIYTIVTKLIPTIQGGIED